MKVEHLKPNPSVSDYVGRILVIENPVIHQAFTLPLFANGTPTLLFTSARGHIGSHVAHLTLFGQTVLPATLKLTDGFHLIAYFLKPYAIPNLFGLKACELTDQPVDLRLLMSKKAAQLENRLVDSKSTNTQMEILDRFIHVLIADQKTDSPAIRYAVNKIVHEPSPDVLRLVQTEIHVTERTFQRLFEKNIGLSPNLYRRVSQFHSAFQQLNQRWFSKLSDVALQNGYADQSHYVRSFKEFTNLLPSEYMRFGERTATK